MIVDLATYDVLALGRAAPALLRGCHLLLVHLLRSTDIILLFCEVLRTQAKSACHPALT